MKKDKWVRWFAREYGVQYCEMVIKTVGPWTAKILPLNFEKDVVLVPENGNEVCFIKERAQKKFTAVCIQKFGQSQGRFKEFLRLFYQLGEDYLAFCQSIAQKRLKNLSDGQLRDIYVSYQEKLVNYSLIGPFIGFVLAGYWFRKGEGLTKGVKPSVREALFKPVKKNTVLVMEEKATQLNLKDEESVIKFWRQYCWLPCLDIHKIPWSLEEAREFIQDAQEKNPPRKKKLSYEQALVRAGLKAKKEIFDLIRQLGYIRDVRDDFRRQGIFYIQGLFNEIGRRAGLTRKEVAYLTEAEVIAFLEGRKIDLKRPRARKKGFLLRMKKGKIVCFDGKEALNELIDLGIEKEEEFLIKLKGTIGCKGQATGKVRIVKTVHDILKVKKGDIMVAVVTHPDYVIAMRKAGAIVTDEGGALSHAAIVSRELGIPCVVGTKLATKVFKQRDVISVDANQGIVKRIKQN